jgi:hypothetical protein
MYQNENNCWAIVIGKKYSVVPAVSYKLILIRQYRYAHTWCKSDSVRMLNYIGDRADDRRPPAEITRLATNESKIETLKTQWLSLFDRVRSLKRHTRFSSPSHAVSLSTSAASQREILSLRTHISIHMYICKKRTPTMCRPRTEMKSPRGWHISTMIVILRVYICLRRRAEKKKLWIVKAGAVWTWFVIFAVWKSHLIRIKPLASWWKVLFISHAQVWSKCSHV